MPIEDTLAQVYPSSFFEQTTSGSLFAAHTVLPLLWQRRKFNSVIDVGCGVGTWLVAARELGASRLCGIDGPHVPPDMMMVDPNVIVKTDLEQPLKLGIIYDLCICLEVAEHLSPSRAKSFVADLTALSSVVVFSAAIPFQGGDGHLNEIWPEYWADLFADHDFQPWDGIRKKIWDIREVPWWYRQNLIIFVRNSEINSLLPDYTPEPLQALTMIHPESYLFNVRRAPPEFKTSYNSDLETYHACANRQRVSPPGYGPEFPAPRPHKDDA
jgi:Ribosomal protein L11 methyltransferase (PrmA)